MAQPLATWVAEHVEPVRHQPPAWLTGHYFHRDPVRAVYSDPELVMSPADGTIIHVDVVRPTDPLGVKGAEITVAELLDGLAEDTQFLAVGIFLSFYDVHVIRAPISGWVTHRRTEPIRTANLPMLDTETALLDERCIVEGGYYANERVISTFQGKGQTVHVVQIADEEVDHVLPFSHRPTSYVQGQRFSQIRFGSHAEVLMPIRRSAAMWPTGTHVQAGVDPIVRFA